jgi:hypothetical protein
VSHLTKNRYPSRIPKILDLSSCKMSIVYHGDIDNLLSIVDKIDSSRDEPRAHSKMLLDQARRQMNRLLKLYRRTSHILIKLRLDFWCFLHDPTRGVFWLRCIGVACNEYIGAVTTYNKNSEEQLDIRNIVHPFLDYIHGTKF